AGRRSLLKRNCISHEKKSSMRLSRIFLSVAQKRKNYESRDGRAWRAHRSRLRNNTEVQRNWRSAAGGYNTTHRSLNLGDRLEQDLILGQNSWIFALKLDLSNASFAQNPRTAKGYLMSDGSERREARRFNMNLPLRVLPREAKGHELEAHTRDLSYQGLYFLAEA